MFTCKGPMVLEQYKKKELALKVFHYRRPRLLHQSCVRLAPVLRLLSNLLHLQCYTVKERTHLPQRVGHIVPGVAVWSCLAIWYFT